MAKPKLALIPATQGSKLYSVLPADGVGDFTFSRNSAATRINKDGLIETVAVGKSRLNYPLIDGVVNGCPSHLLEPQRLQLIQYSEAFDNAWWQNYAGVIPNTAVSPNGTLSADTNFSSGIYPASGGVGNATIVNTASIFAKLNPSGASTMSFTLNRYGSGDAIVCTFDLLLGIAGVTANNGTASGGIAKIDNYGNGWYRCSITGIASTTAGSLSFNPSNNCFIWGAQVEQGSFPTSYIPNYGTSAGITRVAETANGAGDASTFNDSEGVLMAEISALANDGTFRNISLNSGSPLQSIRIFYRSDDNKIQILISSSNGDFYQAEVADATINNKFAVKYKENDTDVFVNGFLVDTMTNVSMPVGLSTLDFYNNNTQPFYGNTKQIQYFDSALNDSDLEKITSWTSFTDLANGQLYSIK